MGELPQDYLTAAIKKAKAIVDAWTPSEIASVNVDKGHADEVWIQNFYGKRSFDVSVSVVEQLKAWSEPEEKKFYAYCSALKDILEKGDKALEKARQELQEILG